MNYDLLTSYINSQEISWRKFSAETGISKSTLYNAISKKILTVSQLEKICNAYSWPIIDFLESPKTVLSEPRSAYKRSVNKLKKRIEQLEQNVTAIKQAYDELAGNAT